MDLSSLFVLSAVMVPLTGHDKFNVREAASVSLATLGPLSHQNLLHGTNSPDPEIVRRCNLLVRNEKQKFVRAWLDAQPMPYIDSIALLIDKRPTQINVWLSMTKGTACIFDGGDHYPYPIKWHEYRRATAIWLEFEMMEGMTMREARTIINTMWVDETLKFRSGEGIARLVCEVSKFLGPLEKK